MHNCVKNKISFMMIAVALVLAVLGMVLTVNKVENAQAYPGIKTVASYTKGEFFTKANDTATSANTVDPVGVDADNVAIFKQTEKSLALMATNFLGTLPLKESYYATRFVFDAYITDGNAAVISIGTEGVWTLGGATPGVTFMVSHNAVYGYYGDNGGTFLADDVKISTGDNGGVRENDYNKITVIVDGSGNASIDVNGIPCEKTISVEGKITTGYCTIGLYGTDLKLKNFTLSTQNQNYSFFGNGNQSDPVYDGVVVEKEIEEILDPEVKPIGTSYYLSATGNDSSAGTSEETAWKSLKKLENIVLMPNDKVLLKRGDVWQDERLTIAGSGSPSYHITVSSYGNKQLPKPIISLSQGEDDIAIVINDFLEDKEGNFRFAPIQFYDITELDIRNTRLGIYVRSMAGKETQKHSKMRNTNIVIKDCDFNNIVCPELMTYLNEPGVPKPTLAERVGEKLRAPKGKLAWSSGNTYVAPDEDGNKGGKQEYIFPAAVFIGGYKMVPSKGLAPCMQNIRLLDCNISEASAGLMMWMYFNYGGSQANMNVYKNVNVENVNMTGVINGGFAFDGVNGGAQDAVNNKVEPTVGTGANDKGVRWGLIENTRIISGTDESYNTFVNGTTGAIFNNTTQFLVRNTEFAGVTNQGNNDGCGFDFETNCKNVEIRSSSFHHNDSGAILIMDSQEKFDVKGPHFNLFFNGNYFYANNRSQKEEYRTINIYSKLHKNVQFNNNVFVMPTKSNVNKAMVLGKPAAGVVINDDLIDPDTFASTNEIYYFGTKVLGNESYESIESPTEFDLRFSSGTAKVNSVIDLNVYKMIKIELMNQKIFDGTIILENFLGQKFEASASTSDGYIDLHSFFGENSEVMHSPIKFITLKSAKAGSATGKLKFTLATNHTIQFLNAKTAIITADGMLPFSGENKENFAIKFDSVLQEIESVKKIGINKVQIIFVADVYDAGVDLLQKNVEIVIKAAAYKPLYRQIVENLNFDNVECSDKIFSDNKTTSISKAEVKEIKLTIESAPKKVAYKDGEALILDGLVVSVTDNNGKKRILDSSEYAVSTQVADSSTITVSYNGLTTTFELDVEFKKAGCGCGSELFVSSQAGILIATLLLAALVFVAFRNKKTNKSL